MRKGGKTCRACHLQQVTTALRFRRSISDKPSTKLTTKCLPHQLQPLPRQSNCCRPALKGKGARVQTIASLPTKPRAVEIFNSAAVVWQAVRPFSFAFRVTSPDAVQSRSVFAFSHSHRALRPVVSASQIDRNRFTGSPDHR